MDEARAILSRLARIDALEREGAHPPVLLAELRALVREAEAWVGAEGRPREAVAALERCRDAIEGQTVAA